MATITKAININIGEANTFDAIVGKQYDKSSRFLKCTFYFNGAVYSIPSGATIKINVKRPDGNSQSFDGVRNADGTATVPLSEWALQINGMVNLSVSIYDGTSKLTSTTFYLNVQEGEGEGYILVYTAGASLQAGTYYITIDGTSYHFTTGETMSAGDKIYFKSTLQTGAHEDTDGERIETFNVATGASGTQLINTELTNFIQNIYNAISARQPRLTAGDNIIITEQNVISALSGTAAPVVQTLGQNMDKVISQKGVTDKFNSVDAVDATQTARIDDIIEKLKGNVYKTQDGASPAYIQSVPANSQAYSALGMIGGKTVVESETLVSAKTDAVKSVGKNLFDNDTSDKETGYAWLTSGTKSLNGNAKIYNIKIMPNTAYSFSGMTNLGTGSICVAWLDASKNFISSAFLRNFTSKENLTSPSNAEYLGYTLTNTENVSATQIEQGSTATAYAPYKSDSFPIPSAIKSLAGYGQSAGSVYNYVDVETKTYRNMKSVDLATLTWGGSAGAWTTTLAGYAGSPLHASIPNTAFSYSGTTLTVASTASPTGILHYQASDSTGTDYEARLYHKLTKNIVLNGSETWSTQVYTNGVTPITAYVTYLSGIRSHSGSGATSICNRFIGVANSGVYDKIKNGGAYVIDGNLMFAVNYDNGSMGVSAWKTWLASNPIELICTLPSEQLLDVTDKFSGDVFIEVENGGTVAFHQEGNVQLEIPNRNTYLVDVFGGY